MTNKNVARLFVAAVLLGINLLLLGCSVFLSGFAEKYLVPIGYYLLLPVKIIVSLLPFSLSEIVIVLLPLVLLFCIVTVIIKTKKGRKVHYLKTIPVIALVLSVLYLMYNLALGFPTHRSSISTQLGWEKSSNPASELIHLAEYLTQKANEERSHIKVWQSYKTFDRSLFKAYENAGEAYPFTSFIPSAPKRILLSKPLSYTQTAGIYIPFFAESNVNVDAPIYSYPFTAAHEMAHSILVASEADANLTAFLVCIDSSDVQLRYSACFYGLLYTFNALVIDNMEEFKRIYQNLSDGVKQDYIDYGRQVRKYEGRFADISQKINDNYLKATGQPDGVKSYGNVVDSLILWYGNKYTK